MFIQVKNLSKKFKNKLAVDKINFILEKNKTVGLLGPNGCGKTTSIGMMLGLVKPTEGEILIEDKNLNKADRVSILSKMNFASPYVELPKKLTVEQNLEIYGRMYDVKNLKEKINELSYDLNLNELLKKTGELSSGQRNRVSLAKSLINNPEILFLDEPTASLDPDIGDYVRGYIESYKKKNKITILLASHNMVEVERLCDSVIMMGKGKIIDQGTCEEIIQRHGRKNLEETFKNWLGEIMRFNQIYALSLRHIYLISSSFPRIIDLIYWPTVQIFLWGFISKFFTLNSEYYSDTIELY